MGRAAELRLLDGLLAAARGGDCRLCWLQGEAGMGKSALLRRFLGGAGMPAVLFASGDEGEARLPFGVLDQLRAGLPAPVAGQRSLPRAGPVADADPLAAGARLVEALGLMTAAGPAVVAVDDLHWCDRPSLQALLFCARRLRGARVLMVVKSRPVA